MAGEANQHAMTATHIPATDGELDFWLLASQRLEAEGLRSIDQASVVLAVQRLVQEVVLGRALRKNWKVTVEELERALGDARRDAQARTALVQQAEERANAMERRALLLEEQFYAAKEQINQTQHTEG